MWTRQQGVQGSPWLVFGQRTVVLLRAAGGQIANLRLALDLTASLSHTCSFRARLKWVTCAQMVFYPIFSINLLKFTECFLCLAYVISESAFTTVVAMIKPQISTDNVSPEWWVHGAWVHGENTCNLLAT